MTTVIASRRVRPIRFAFLVQPNNLGELRRVFRANTVLWGGRYNVVVPAWKRAPRYYGGGESGRQLVARFLDAAEPDFVVCGKTNARDFGVPDDRVVTLDQLLNDPRLPRAGFGVGALYRRLYQDDYRFVARHPPNLVYTTGKGRLGAFSAARFGEIPDGPWSFCLEWLRALGAVEVPLDASTYLGSLLEGRSPLALGSERLGNPGIRPMAYLLIDPMSFSDLVDYWNLRAFGWRVLPIPRAWAKELQPMVSQMLEDNNGPEKGLKSDFSVGHIIRGHSVPATHLRVFVDGLTAPPENFRVRPSFPQYWQRERWDWDHTERPELVAHEDDIELTPTDGKVSFLARGPDFADISQHSSICQWANVVRLRSYNDPEVAEVMPRTLKDIGLALAPFGPVTNYRMSSEGITVLTFGSGELMYWCVPDGFATFKQWLAPRYTVSMSSAGTMAQRLIRVVGGPEAARAVCSPPLLRLFEKARRSASQSVPFDEFWIELMKEFRNSKETVSLIVERWVDRKVIDVGFQITCTQCGQKNWYALESLAKLMTCARCLEPTPYPVAHPQQAIWAVRPLGPFAVEGKSHGAATIALTIRLLRHFGAHARTAWAPGLLLEQKDGSKLEVDFAMLRHDAGPWTRPVRVVFGECKTFWKFEQKDVSRMRRVAQEFPGAFLVFASLNNSITEAEARALRRIASFGRRDWRNPVIVLTAIELANDWNVPDCWKVSHPAVARQIPTLMSLTALADATQQIHLGLPPGPGWPHPRETEQAREVAPAWSM